MAIIRMTIPIQGMSCQNCIRSIERGVGKTSGVLSARADLLRKVAEISFDDSVTSEREVKSRIRELGFEVA